MKRLMLLMMACAWGCATLSALPTLNSVLARLDSVIAAGDSYIAAKQTRVDEAVHRAAAATGPEERYWLNRTLYDEVYVFNADSAMRVVDRNLAMARSLDDINRINEWKIRRSFVLSATGLLKEAADEIMTIDPERLDASLHNDYYGQMAYLYSHLGQFSSGQLRDEYYTISRAMEDSIMSALDPRSPQYLWMKGWRGISQQDRRAVVSQIKGSVDSTRPDTRAAAMNAYALGMLYKELEMRDSAEYYLAMAAIADVTSATRDIASLQDLGMMLNDDGDTERAFNYVNYAIKEALSYPARGRLIALADMEKNLGQSIRRRNEQRQQRTTVLLWLSIGLAVVLAAMLWYVARQVRRLHSTRRELSEANTRLSRQMDELSAGNVALTEAHTALRRANETTIEANAALGEANYVKEQCISSMFGMCSNYINTMESFRKEVSRKLKARQYDDIQRLAAGAGRSQSELKEFYRSIDTVVLNIFPNFVDEFNSLLRPEERIVPRDGELLNTTLRIYALVRLGITDSVKIAAMLHMSAQTVYNNRMAARNKSIVPREDFVDSVRRLGTAPR